jgi:hypothetical protein
MKMTRAEREALGRTRLIRVLRAHGGVASMRTLEMKISDSGPNPMRIDPHILTDARENLRRARQIDTIPNVAGKWYFLTDFAKEKVAQRYAELAAVQGEFAKRNFNTRLGQTLELAIYRALEASNCDFLGRFPELADHGDHKLYKKDEPPNYIGVRRIPDDRQLDFLAHYADGWAGIECKNIREWLYPDRAEIRQLIDKCLYLDCIPVLIARRIHISTFFVFNKCGLIIHQMYNQLLPQADAELAAKAKDKALLGYHDIRLGNQPDARLLKFVLENLPQLVGTMRPRWEQYKDLLQAYARDGLVYTEFAARVRRRHDGADEDGDWDDAGARATFDEE